MPIEKPRKDERVSAAYKSSSSSKQTAKSIGKRKDDTKQRHAVVSDAIPKNQDKRDINKNNPLKLSTTTSEVTKYGGNKTKSHVGSAAETKKTLNTSRSRQKPENVQSKSTRNYVKPAEQLPSKVSDQRRSSSVKANNKTDIGGKIKEDKRVITNKDIGADLARTSVDVSDGNTVDEKPKITRQDTFELPTVTENVDEDDDSVSYVQDFEDYESDFEIGEDEAEEDDEGLSEENVTNDCVNIDQSYDHEPGNIREIATSNASEIVSHLKEEISTRASQNVVIKDKYVHQIAEIKQERPKTASFHNFINFADSQEARRRKQVTDKIRNRGIKLLQLLTLDTMNFDIFEMKPVKYSIFMLAFGGLNKVQVKCQTELDGSEAETQTDEIKTLEKWTEHPADCTNACGGQSLDNDSRKMKQLESKRLVKVLRIASKTVEILLDEELMRYSSGKDSQGLLSSLDVCNGVIRLTPPDFMKGGVVTSLHRSENNPFVILSAHKSLPQPMDGHGAVCVWDLLQPIKPKRVLLCATHITRCCFASRKLAAVVAGAIDGSLMIWDLQDTVTEYNITCSDVPLYSPTYSTAGIIGHRSRIVDVQHLTAKYNNTDAKDDGPTQIASLEEFAVFMVWVIVEAKGSEDVRLAPDGRLIMVPSARVELNSLINPSANAQVFGFEAHPREPNNFFVTTDLGVVVNFKLNGGKVKQYKHSPDVPVEVSAISVCASDQRRTCFLAGCNDGTVRLHAIDSERPIISWAKAANGAPIKTVMWSTSGPNIFFILDSFGQLHVWDLTYSDVHLCFSSDSKIAKYECAVIGSDPRGGFRKEKRTFQPYLAFGTSEGIVEVNYLKDNYSRYGKEEVDLFNFYLDIL